MEWYDSIRIVLYGRLLILCSIILVVNNDNLKCFVFTLEHLFNKRPLVGQLDTQKSVTNPFSYEKDAKLISVQNSQYFCCFWFCKMYKNVSAVIVEQPASKVARFRYACEGRSAGSIPGISSTTNNKTYPSICIQNYTGSAAIVVSCVTRNKPYRPHPHSLVGKDCVKGVCRIDIVANGEPKAIDFPHLGIQCVKRNQVEEMLKERETIDVDPFKTGFKHRDDAKCLDLSVVRLCFQIFLKPDPTNERRLVGIKPIVSDPIYDKKSVTELVIYDISDTTSPTNGGKKIMVFCDKVLKEDIKVRFYEVTENDSWEAWGVFDPSNVHRQTAIAFKTPEYKLQDIDGPVTVFMQLVRPSDNLRSKSVAFQYIPDVSNMSILIRNKKRKIEQGQQLHKYLITSEQREREQRQIPKMELNITPDIINQNVPYVVETERNQTTIASNYDFANNNWQLQSNQHLNNPYGSNQQHHANHHLSQQSHHQHQMPPNNAESVSSQYKSYQYYSNVQYPYHQTTNQFYNNVPTTSNQTQNWSHYLPTQINHMHNISGPSHAFMTNQNSYATEINQINNISGLSHNYTTNRPNAVQAAANYEIQTPEIENLSDYLNSNLSL